MSIRLLQPILIAGAHYPVDGQTLFFDKALEDSLVGQGKAARLDTQTSDDILKHRQEHMEMGVLDDGGAGPAVVITERNLPHDSVTSVLLPSAPSELALMWSESGTSGPLRYVLEAASLADATARLSDDAAHAEIVSGDGPMLIRFVPTTAPMYLYVRASAAFGAGSNLLTIIAKVPA